MIEFHTNKGTITIEVDHDNAPKTAANFVQYARDGFYDGSLLHRVIPGFVIQGGGMSSGMKEKPTRGSIENEAENGLKNQRGTLSMARTNDPHSASSQFFINLNDNASLDHKSPTPAGWGYCVFGRVTGGMDVVDDIAKAATGSSGFHRDVPVEEIIVERAVVVE